MYRSVTYRLQPTAASGPRSARCSKCSGSCTTRHSRIGGRPGAGAEEFSRSRFEQFGELSELSVLRPDLSAFGVCVARGTLTRLDLAFQGFHRRVRAGERPGYC